MGAGQSELPEGGYNISEEGTNLSECVRCCIKNVTKENGIIFYEITFILPEESQKSNDEGSSDPTILPEESQKSNDVDNINDNINPTSPTSPIRSGGVHVKLLQTGVNPVTRSNIVPTNDYVHAISGDAIENGNSSSSTSKAANNENGSPKIFTQEEPEHDVVTRQISSSSSASRGASCPSPCLRGLGTGFGDLEEQKGGSSRGVSSRGKNRRKTSGRSCLAGVEAFLTSGNGYYNSTAHHRIRIPHRFYELVENGFQGVKGDRWQVKRRFREFDALHDKMSNKYNTAMPILPSKSWFGKTLTREEIEERRKDLEVYLNALLSLDSKPFPKTQCLSTFIMIPVRLTWNSWVSSQTGGGIGGNQSLNVLEKRLMIRDKGRKSLVNQQEFFKDILLSDTNLLSFIFSWLPAKEMQSICPLVCTSFWLASMSTYLWKDLKLIHTHSPVEYRLEGVYRLLTHVGKNLTKLHLEFFVANKELVQLLPWTIQFRSLREVWLGTSSRNGVELILSFLEAISDAEHLRHLTLDTPFDLSLLKEVHSIILLQSFQSLFLESLCLYFRPDSTGLLGGPSSRNPRGVTTSSRNIASIVNGGDLDLTSLEIPQEPLIDWIFKEPPEFTSSSGEENRSPSKGNQGKSSGRHAEEGRAVVNAMKNASPSSKMKAAGGPRGSGSGQSPGGLSKKAGSRTPKIGATGKDQQNLHRIRKKRMREKAREEKERLKAERQVERERIRAEGGNVDDTDDVLVRSSPLQSSSPTSESDTTPTTMRSSPESGASDNKRSLEGKRNPNNNDDRFIRLDTAFPKKKINYVIPNKEQVFNNLSMSNADSFFADEYALPPEIEENSTSNDDRKVVSKKKPRYHHSIKKFAIGLSRYFIGSGIRRDFRELPSSNPSYWDKIVNLPLISPILRNINTHFPSLIEVEIDFLTENLIWALRDPVIRNVNYDPRTGRDINHQGGHQGDVVEILRGQQAQQQAQQQALILGDDGNLNPVLLPLLENNTALPVVENLKFPDKTFLPNIRTFTLRGNLFRIKHVKDIIFGLLMKKLGPYLETFKFLPEAEASLKDMAKNTIVGRIYANLNDELRGREQYFKHLEVDYIFFNFNALQNLQTISGKKLEVLRLNSCEVLQDESVELLVGGNPILNFPALRILRLRASDGLTEAAVEHLIKRGQMGEVGMVQQEITSFLVTGNRNQPVEGRIPLLNLELEPSYSHSDFMLGRLSEAYDNGVFDPMSLIAPGLDALTRWITEDGAHMPRAPPGGSSGGHRHNNRLPRLRLLSDKYTFYDTSGKIVVENQF